MTFRSLFWNLLMASSAACMLAACARPGTVPVNIHGVNYTAQGFSYRLQDPARKENHGGGEIVDSYAAGGTLCCYDLPRSWRPGIKVEIHTIRWEVLPPHEENLKEIREMRVVELPRYVDNRPGELWVVRHADGSCGVVSSDYQPDHPKWPGTVKGWPVPSVEYRRSQWDLHIKVEEGSVRVFQEALLELETAPESLSKETWEAKQEEVSRFADLKADTERIREARKDREFLAKFSGPSDPKFIQWLKQRYRSTLDMSLRKLERLKESRP